MSSSTVRHRHYPWETRQARPSPRPTERTLMTTADAAELLGLSTRTIQRYATKGVIRRVWKDGKRGLVADDVRDLRVNTGADSNPGGRVVTPRPIDFALIQQRLRGVEGDMQIVTTILDNSGKGLELDRDAAVSLLRSAQYFANHGWPPGSKKEWAEIFLRLRREDVRKIEKAVGRELGWLPFWRLAGAMARAALDCDDDLYRLLRAACDHVERIGVECIEELRGKRKVKRQIHELAGIDRNALRRARDRHRHTDTAGDQPAGSNGCQSRDQRLRAALAEFAATQANI